MSLLVSAAEVFEMAEQIERNGARFYRRAAEGVSDGGARDLLLRFAAMEDDHEVSFAAMKKEHLATIPPGVQSIPGDEECAYIREWLSGQVFDLRTDPVSRLTGRESAADVLRMAIQAEKDSVVFYLGLRDLVPKGQGADRVNAIITEEMGHITMLNRELARIS